MLNRFLAENDFPCVMETLKNRGLGQWRRGEERPVVAADHAANGTPVSFSAIMARQLYFTQGYPPRYDPYWLREIRRTPDQHST